MPRSVLQRMHRFLSELSLFYKLFYGIVLIVLFMLAMSSVSTYTYSRNTYEREASNNAGRLVNGLNTGFREYLDSVDRIIMSIYADLDANETSNSLKEVLSTKTYSSITDQYLELQATNTFFQRLMNLRQDFSSLYLYISPYKQFSYAAYGKNKLTYDPTREDWYTKTIAADGSTIISEPHLPFQLDYGKKVISFSRVLKRFDSADEKAYGVILIDFSIDSIKNLVDKMDLGDSTQVVLLNQAGHIVYTDESAILPADIDRSILDRMQTSQEGKFIAIVRGTKYLISHGTIQATGWKSMTLTPYSDIQRGSKRLLFFDLLLAFIALLFTILITYAFSLRIFKPVRALKQGIVQVRQGNFEFQIESKSQDELGLLVVSFNRMVSTIKTLILEKYEEKLARRNAEYKYLQTQMNPHFMYNTLQIINGMAIVNDVPDISTVSNSLAKMLRYGINMNQKSVTVKEEMENVVCYLDIQKLRFREYFDYEIFVDESLHPYEMTKLILQPIVENAFAHGIEPKGENGKIRITANVAGDALRVEVLDNGNGMSPSELERLLREINEQEAEDGVAHPAGEHNGVGLRNIQNRLKLMYGPEYGLTIDSHQNEWTRVMIDIPLRRAKGDQ